MGFFDHFADSSSTKIGDKLSHKKNYEVFKVISKYIKNKSSILEIGAGKGELAKIFLENKYLRGAF